MLFSVSAWDSAKELYGELLTVKAIETLAHIQGMRTIEVYHWGTVWPHSATLDGTHSCSEAGLCKLCKH